MIIHTNKAPAAIGPYCQAQKIGNFLFTSGQLGIDTATGKLAEGIEAQTRASLKNLGEILKEAGTDFGHVIKATIFLKDLNDFKTVNEIYGSCFSGDYPARSCVQVAKLPMDGMVEIEVIAVCD